jgi:murein DD-endopeptidase MepM/ murein hydrolase activator NlpD
MTDRQAGTQPRTLAVRSTRRGRDRIARLRIGALAAAASLTVSIWAAPASAEEPVPSTGGQISSGGVSEPGPPAVETTPGPAVVQRVVCKTGCLDRRTATIGGVVKVKGQFLGDNVDYVAFRGTAGPMLAALTYRDPVRVRAIVPPGAISSRPYVVDEGGMRSNRAPRKLTIRPAVVAPGTGVFPVLGPHTYGGAGSRFGAQRNGHIHQGQDVAAACGTPLVSAMAGTVQYRGYQSAGAGNYIVIDNNGTDTDFAYMHMAAPAMVAAPQFVAAGQQIGMVGNTGASQGCHLHFEYWQGDWWGGGEPIDPLPYLQAWDATS